MISSFLIFICLVTIGVSLWFLHPPAMFGYIAGLIFGIILILSFLRKLGLKARKSVVATAIFKSLTKYQATIYRIDIKEKPVETIATVYGDGDDFTNLIDVLKRQMRFPADRAKIAARYAMDVAHNQPLHEKIRVALQSLDNSNNGKKGNGDAEYAIRDN